MTKTYDDFLNNVARKHGQKNWAALESNGFGVSTGQLIEYMKEAALLYGESKWNQACEEMAASLKINNSSRAFEFEASITKPTFKP